MFLCRNIVDIENSVWLWCNRHFGRDCNYANRNCNTNIFIQRPRSKPHARKSVLTAKINGRHWVLRIFRWFYFICVLLNIFWLLLLSCVLAVFGFDFGHIKHTPAERMGESQTEYTWWISESVVKAMSTAGLFSSLSVVLTSGSHTGSMSEIISYIAPDVSANRHGNQPARASTMVTVFGRNYGQASFTVRQKFQDSSAQRTDWDSDSSITAMPSDGLGASIRLILSAGIRIGTRTRAFTYNIPQVRIALTRQNLPSVYFAAQSITLSGSSLGVFHKTQNVRVGKTGCESTAWISETSVVATCGTGTFATQGFTVTAVVARVTTRTEVNFFYFC